MSQDLKCCVIQIRDAEGFVYGTGFIMDPTTAVTCAHVIEAAGAGPGDSVTIAFALAGDTCPAEVLPDGWCPADGDDIAILRLRDEPPPGITPAILGSSQDTGGHSFRAFGYPEVSDIQGVWAEGKILGPITDSQGTTMLQLRAQEIAQGMSGAPVLDTDDDRVVGMVTATYTPDKTLKLRDAAFATPIEVIAHVWPSLELAQPISRPSDITPPAEMALSREAQLEELARASRARCIERWQAAGVPRDEASGLADDLSIGGPEGLDLETDQAIQLLIGELGTGKSLIVERLLQRAIRKACEQGDAPVPVYLEARSCAGRLHEAAEDAAIGLGNPHIQGATIIIDGADEAGLGLAASLLREARILTNTWPETKVIITSRPIPTLTKAEEAVQVFRLAKAEAYALISRLAGRPVTENYADRWPESVRDSIERPLFAVLMGTYLRKGDTGVPQSTGELISNLVEQALGQASANFDRSIRLLQRLATLSVDRGGGLVPIAEVAASQADLHSLLESRLVVTRDKAFSFPLPILTEWFAAQSLAADSPSLGDLINNPQRLDNWRYPLIVFVGNFDHERVSRLLVSLAQKYPAFAGEIVTAAVATGGDGEELPPPSPQECGQRIRAAMQAWIDGVGPLTQLIAPVRANGSLLPIGTRTSGTRLTTSWYRGPDKLAGVVDLPPSVRPLGPRPPGWCRLKHAPTGHQSAWAWRWALEELVQSLSELLRNLALPVNDGPLVREMVWLTALTITGRGGQDPNSIRLNEIEDYFLKWPQGVIPAHEDIAGLRRCNLDQLQIEVNRLREAGETELHAPWPGPDRDYFRNPGWVWDPYSDEQILTRAEAIYMGALEGYQQCVNTWFPKLAPRLRVATTLPARLVGMVVPPGPGKGPFSPGPSIHWTLVPLPHGSQDVTDFQLSEEDTAIEKFLSLTTDQLDRFLAACRRGIFPPNAN